MLKDFIKRLASIKKIEKRKNGRHIVLSKGVTYLFNLKRSKPGYEIVMFTYSTRVRRKGTCLVVCATYVHFIIF